MYENLLKCANRSRKFHLNLKAVQNHTMYAVTQASSSHFMRQVNGK
jgi:hypothetical protein